MTYRNLGLLLGLGTLALLAPMARVGGAQARAHDSLRRCRLGPPGPRLELHSHIALRRYLESGCLPPPELVHVDELLNQYDYHYPGPPARHSYALYAVCAPCPWDREKRLLHLGLKGKPGAPAAQLQLCLDPKRVSSARRVGYEEGGMVLKFQHTVTALFELTLRGRSGPLGVAQLSCPGSPGQGYLLPPGSCEEVPGETWFAVSVAWFGVILHQGGGGYDPLLELAQASLGPDRKGRRRDFLHLVRAAREISGILE